MDRVQQGPVGYAGGRPCLDCGSPSCAARAGRWRNMAAVRGCARSPRRHTRGPGLARARGGQRARRPDGHAAGQGMADPLRQSCDRSRRTSAWPDGAPIGLGSRSERRGSPLPACAVAWSGRTHRAAAACRRASSILRCLAHTACRSPCRPRRAEANCEPDAELHTALGDLLASQSRWAEALQSYIEAAGLKQAAGASGKEIADCHADCGFCLQALGRLDQAQEVLELALNHDPVHPKAATYLAQVHMLRDPEEGWKNAIRYARIATQNAPTEIVGYKLQARAALRGKWTHEFKTALEHAYAISPDDPELHELQGWYYFQEGKLEIALAEAEQAIEHDPQSATGYHLLAEILKSQKRWTEAMAALRTAVRLDGNYTGAIKALTSIGLEALMHGNRR